MSTEPILHQKPRKERKENADMRRQQLLDATLRSIAANGLAKTTLATVAAQAGLSQGVAVFYFKSKTGLLAGALQEHYRRYHDNWNAMLDQAGSDPLERLITLIESDFAPTVCDAQALSVWFAFWGELRFTPQYADVSIAFDMDRTKTIRALCAQLMPNADPAEADLIADWIDTLTDGYWQRLHVYPDATRRQDAVHMALKMIAKLLPDHAERIMARLV